MVGAVDLWEVSRFLTEYRGGSAYSACSARSAPFIAPLHGVMGAAAAIRQLYNLLYRGPVTSGGGQTDGGLQEPGGKV